MAKTRNGSSRMSARSEIALAKITCAAARGRHARRVIEHRLGDLQRGGDVAGDNCAASRGEAVVDPSRVAAVEWFLNHRDEARVVEMTKTSVSAPDANGRMALRKRSQQG